MPSACQAKNNFRTNTLNECTHIYIRVLATVTHVNANRATTSLTAGAHKVEAKSQARTVLSCGVCLTFDKFSKGKLL